RPYLGVPQQVRQLGRGEPGVERYEDRSDRHGGEHGLDERGMVGSEVGDPVTGLDTQPGERAAEPIDALGDLPVGPLRTVVDQGYVVGCYPGPAPRPGPDPLVAHARPLLRTPSVAALRPRPRSRLRGRVPGPRSPSKSWAAPRP